MWPSTALLKYFLKFYFFHILNSKQIIKFHTIIYVIKYEVFYCGFCYRCNKKVHLHGIAQSREVYLILCEFHLDHHWQSTKLAVIVRTLLDDTGRTYGPTRRIIIQFIMTKHKRFYNIWPVKRLQFQFWHPVVNQRKAGVQVQVEAMIVGWNYRVRKHTYSLAEVGNSFWPKCREKGRWAWLLTAWWKISVCHQRLISRHANV